MNDLFMLLFLVCTIAVPCLLIIGIVKLIRKRPATIILTACLISFIIGIISFIGFGMTIPEDFMASVAESTKPQADSPQKESTQIPTQTSDAKNNEETDSSNLFQTEPTSEEVIESLPETAEETPSDKENFIQILTQNPDVASSAAENTYDILLSLGFENITVENNSMGTLFDIKADDYNLKITVSDKLYRIICGNINLYEDDSVKYTKQDLIDRSLNGNEVNYYIIAQEIISSNLKSPNTADFPSIALEANAIKMARNKDLVVVQSYVDAQNSFGAEIRTQYTVQFRIIDLDSFSYETTYINMDGSESGEYINMD